MDANRFDNKHVLVTGASSGIGSAIAVRFAQEGANVAINYGHDEIGAEATMNLVERATAEVPGRKRTHLIVRADVSVETDVKRMFGTVLDAWGRLDVLINNAGIQKISPSEAVPAEDFDRVLGVNLRGTFLCAREAVRQFLSQGGGVIVNDSSVHQEIPRPQYLSYAISKGGLEQLTRTLALEYADRGIRVNAVGPGAIATPINAAWDNDPEARKAVEKHIPMARVGTPEEIAGVFEFLASDEAAYITGQTLFADGGLTLFADFRSPWSGVGERAKPSRA